MGGTLIKLKETKEVFTKNEQKISDFILANIEDIRNLNTYDLALKIGVSQASIVRFSKKLGFKGFPEFKLALSTEVATIKKKENINIIYDEIRLDDSIEILSQKVVYENKKAIEDTYKVLNFDELDKAASAIEKASRIFILGVGFSGIVARDLQVKLWELGKAVIFDTDQHIQFTNAATVSESDVVIAISHSGKTLDVYNTLLNFKEKGATIITLTKFANNPIKDLGEISLSTVVEKSNLRSTSLSTRIAQLTVVDILYIKLIQRNREVAEKFIGNALETVKKMKM